VRFLARIPSLDGLRAMAVVLTSLVHLIPNWVPGGFLGVDVFFVLSGFLITSLLLGEFERAGRINLRAFYARRARRLLPAVVALIAVFTIVAIIMHDTVRDLIVAAVVDLTVLTYTFNWTMVLGHQPPWQVDHLWSLSVEEQFYLLWPLLLIVLIKFASRRTVMTVTLALALGSAVAQAVVFDITRSTDWAYSSSPLHAQGILLGCLLGQLYVWRVADGAMARLAALKWPAVVSLAVILVLSLVLGVDDMITYDGGMFFAVLAATVLVATMIARDTLGQNTGVLSRMFSSKVFVAIGKRSYSIYLWQNFMAWALTPMFRETWIWIPVNVIATGIASELSYRFVENIFMKKRTKSREKVTSPVS
jgi:peptidoglycan/LPS O-acetylase OafA/YrhL